MSVYDLKPRFQALLRPLVLAAYRAGITANQVTVLACMASIAVAAAIVAAPERTALFLLVPVWLFVRMALNAMDGMLAREFGQATPLGAYLNELTDVISDAALYLPFALLPGSGAWWVGGIIVLAVISEMAGILGATIGGSRRYDGPMGKSDRALVFGILGLLAGAGVMLAPVINWIWAAMAVAIVATIVNRVRKGLTEVRPNP